MMELVMESIVGPLVNAVLVANLSLTGAGTALSVQIPNTQKSVANLEVPKTDLQKIQYALNAMPDGVLKTWPKEPFRLVTETQVGHKNSLIFEARTGQHPLVFQRIQFDLFPTETESNQRKVEMKREVCQQKAAEPSGYHCTLISYQGDEASQYLKVLLEKEKTEYQAKR